ncbi:hypothetical protein, conserved [Eimeria maxima]|uniref:Multiple myeloma tumor-associated protein 2-like N-terminal domain-containing protein n=1 Tax=Eimeria maxima TaxID=5804 RepID=U6M8B5_EIMMA|nr:hypothetical protein, conserved [Eimeria maxima]CDJ60266.1 hypothetical protein, conserved [Eimeria maxima]
MAVYIKQSPPREGVRGGWEDFKWESLKTQTNADRDYYLGASAKVGICTRGGKFEKYDWWTKKKEADGPSGVEDEELRRVKRFEQQLLEEALGRRPRHLLAGEALADEEPAEPPVATTAAADDRRAAEKALKKLKKEQRKLKKLRKKEHKREAKRLRLKRERHSESRSPRRRSSSVDNERRGDSHRHGRVKRRRGSPSPSNHDTRKSKSRRADGPSVDVARIKRCSSEERRPAEMRLEGKERMQREERREQRDKDRHHRDTDRHHTRRR